MFVFFFKQKTAYEMRISDWSSDVCSSDLVARLDPLAVREVTEMRAALEVLALRHAVQRMTAESLAAAHQALLDSTTAADIVALEASNRRFHRALLVPKSEEHTSELQSLMRISYAVFCLKKKKKTNK